MEVANMDGKRPCLGAVSKVSLPFYEPPPRKTSAEIISEARAAIKDSHVADASFASTSIRPLQTQRPFTPRNKERILFGQKSKTSRPPSSFSLRYLQSEADLGCPPIPIETNGSTVPPLSPLGSKSAATKKEIFKKQRSNSVSNIKETKVFNVDVSSMGVHKLKLPALDTLKPLQKKNLYKNTYSLDNLPEEHEEAEQSNIVLRKAFSSPQERTDFHPKDSPFGRPSQQQSNLSQCLLLGPQNFFGNKHIMEHSERLFMKTGYINNVNERTKLAKSSLDNSKQDLEGYLELLNDESLKKNNDDTVIELLNKLYDCLENDSSNANINSKIKIRILKCLYRFVESQNEKLLLGIARIILTLKVTGNNLSGVCKLIFKVAKNDKNDLLFLEGNILDLFVDSLGRCSPLDDGEACVYGYGAVKFLTMNPKLLTRLLKLGVLQLMVLHVKLVNNSKTEKLQIPEQTDHALFQLTGALRNLASEESIYDEFISSETVFQLCHTLDLFSSNLDIVSNISRTLSTISTNDNCCDKIAEYGGIYKILVKLFDKYPGNEEIIVRLAYTLGNILARLDNSRIKFYQEKNSIHNLIYLWKIYLERTLKNCSLKLDNEDPNESNTEDVMIKIIRIVANLAINTDIGRAMIDNYGMQLIDEFLKVLISNPFRKNDELILSVLITLNNLSYYYTADFDRDIFNIKQIDIMEAISEYVNSSNMDCAIESIRILGNLSRSKITRSYVVGNNIFYSLVNILDKDDFNLLKTTVGVFVNLMADNENRLLFKKHSGLSKLIHILNMHGQYDWSLSMLICQAIWNFCVDSINLYDLITDSEMQQLLAVLADYLDEERLFGITDTTEDLDTYQTSEYIVWEEFANVATNLLEKIEQFLDTLEQLELSAPQNTEQVSVFERKDASTGLNFAAW